MNRPRRPRSRLLLTAVAAVVLLAACGSDSDSAATTAAATTAPAATTAAGTRTVSTPHGPVEVPADPQRIVSVQPYATSTLFDLGIDPVGTYDEGEEYVAGRYLDQWKATPKIGTAGEFNLEALSALRPDLIVGVDYEFIADEYDQLSAIAPTVLVSSEGSWRDAVVAVADAVNADAGVAELQAQYEAKAKTIASTYAAQLAAAKFDFVQGGFDPGNYWIYGPSSSVVEIAQDAGVELGAASAGTTEANRSVSYEQADLLQDATVIAFYAGADGSPLNDLDQLFAMPIFTNLPAVEAGNTLPVPDFLPGSYGDAMGVLDSIEAQLKEL